MLFADKKVFSCIFPKKKDPHLIIPHRTAVPCLICAVKVYKKAVLGHYAVTIKIWDCELCDQSDQPERGFDELWSSSFGVPTKIGGGESGILTFHFGEIIFQLRLSSPSIWSSTPPPFLIMQHFSLFSQQRAGQRRKGSANAIVYFSTCWGIHYRSFPSL